MSQRDEIRVQHTGQSHSGSKGEKSFSRFFCRIFNIPLGTRAVPNQGESEEKKVRENTLQYA